MGAALVLLLVALGALAAGALIGRYYVPDDRQLRRSARHSRAYMRALSHLIARDHETVMAELLAVVEENVEDVEPYFALGALFRSRGEHERAIRVHQALAVRERERRKLRHRAMYELGLDFRAAGMPRRATRAMEKVLIEEPGHEGALRALAALYEEQARFNEAAGLWQRLGRRRGEDLSDREHHLLVAAAQAALGRDDLDSAKQLLKAAQKHGESAHFCAAAAELAAARGNHRRAKERLKQALIADPGLAPHLLPGVIAAEQGLAGRERPGAESSELDDEPASEAPALAAPSRPALPAPAGEVVVAAAAPPERSDRVPATTIAPTPAFGTTPPPGTAEAPPPSGTAAASPLLGSGAAAPLPGTAAGLPLAGAAAAAPLAGAAAGLPPPGAAAASPLAGAAAGLPQPETAAGLPPPGAAAGLPLAGTAAAPPSSGSAAAPPPAATAAADSLLGLVLAGPGALAAAAAAAEARPAEGVSLVPAQRPAGSIADRVLAVLAEVEAQCGPRLELALIRAQLVPASEAARQAELAAELLARFPEALAARVAAARLAIARGDAAAIRGALDGLVSDSGALAWSLRGRWQCAHCSHRPPAFSWRCAQCRRWSTLRMETGIEPPPLPPRERRAVARAARPEGLLGAPPDQALPAATLDAGLSDAELASAGTRRSLLGRVGGWFSGVWRRDGS